MPNRLITLATFHNPADAGFVKSLLEAEGIRTFLADEVATGMLSYLSNAIGWVKVQVDEQDLSRANEIITIHRQTIADLGQEAFAAEATNSPIAGEKSESAPASRIVDEPQDEIVDPTEDLASRAFRAAAIGVVCHPLLLYAAWLIGKLLFSRAELSATASRKLWLAIGMTFLVFLGYWIFLTNPFGSRWR